MAARPVSTTGRRLCLSMLRPRSLGRTMMADGATGDRAEHSMPLADEMPGDTTDGSAFEASFRIGGNRDSKRARGGDNGNEHLHGKSPTRFTNRRADMV